MWTCTRLTWDVDALSEWIPRSADAHIQRLMSRMAGILAGPPVIVSYQVVDE